MFKAIAAKAHQYIYLADGKVPDPNRNAPGALGTLDNLMAQHGLNIVSQTLQTKGQIGYVITDVEGQVDDVVMSTLRSHPITVRCDRL